MKKDGRLKKNLYLCGLKQSFMPMDKYAIYSYSLVAKPRRNELIPSDDNQLINDMSLEQRFELLFGQKPGADFPVQKIKKGGADKRLIMLHKPHPGNIVKGYALKQVLEELRKAGFIK